MRQRILAAPIALAASVAAMPAHAEKLTFDHRLYPPLKASLDSGDAAKVAYDNSNPRYVTDLIVAKGASVNNWTEALEIVVRTPAKKVRTAKDWAAELKAAADRACRPQLTPIAEDDSSLTFERRAPACPQARAETTITRIFQGKRSLFLLSVLIKGVPDAPAREQWLALLRSAHLE